jgi:hypothetical protein
VSELDELERDLEEAANIWFSPALHRKIKRVIAIARAGEKLFAGVVDATTRLDRSSLGREEPATRSQLRFDAEHDLGV